MLKKRVGLVVVLMLLMVSAFCGCETTEDKITGRWEKTEGSGLDYFEFFSDGTYVSSHPNYAGSYSIDGNRIRLEGILMETLVRTFELNGNTLSLQSDSGSSAIYKRID